MAHGRRGDVTQRVVVRPFLLHAAESEAFRRESAFEAVGLRAPSAAELLVLVEVERHGHIVGIELQRRQAERGEVKRLVDLDHRSRRLVDQVDRQQQVLARGVQHRDVAPEACVDPAEPFERRRHRSDECRVAPQLRDTFEPDVTLLAQPVERVAPEHDAVLCSRLRESQLDVAGRHRPILDAASPVTRRRCRACATRRSQPCASESCRGRTGA